jgi:hypothetical protein
LKIFCYLLLFFRAPLTPIDFWNISERIAEDLPRTTNSVEAWHHALGHSLKEDHSSIWRIFEIMKEEFSLSNAHASSQRVDPKNNQKQKYERITEDIQKKRRELLDETIGTMPYLRSICQKFNYIC